MYSIPLTPKPIRIFVNTQLLQQRKQLYYVYPTKQLTSFHIVASKHIQYISDRYNIIHVDENAFQFLDPIPGVSVILHPALYILERSLSRFQKSKYSQLLAFDVCDSDRMSDHATYLLNLLDKVAVPSEFCVKVYKDSGVRAKIYRIPHGLDKEWYEKPNLWETMKNGNIDQQLANIYDYKKRTGKKILLFWLWHSADRKGWAEVAETFKRLKKKRNDITLVVKTVPVAKEPDILLEEVGSDVLKITNWLSEHDKMALYDLAEINLNFSRGGGFEINCLEALARGIPCLSTDFGSWLDYEHPSFLIKRGEKVEVLPGNLYHVGYGYKVDVDDAVAKIEDILDNYEEYKAIAEEHRQKLKEEFEWSKIAEKIIKMIEER